MASSDELEWLFMNSVNVFWYLRKYSKMSEVSLSPSLSPSLPLSLSPLARVVFTGFQSLVFVNKLLSHTLSAVLPDRALNIPTFSHFLIVKKTSLSLSLSLSL